MRTAQRLVPILLFGAACSRGVSNDRALVSPDQRHVVFVSAQGTVRSIDVTTGLEVARAEHLDIGYGTFSASGAVLLTQDRAGHLITFRVDGGKPIDLGLALDSGRISPDGTWVAYLANAQNCPVAQLARGPGDALVCADLYAVSSGGGAAARVGSGVRVYLGSDGHSNGYLDRYQFAGNDHLIFDNDTGSLYSTLADGSAPPFEVSPRLGLGENTGVPESVLWSLLADGSKIFFYDAAGLHLAGPDGKNALLIDTDYGYPSCDLINGRFPRCAISAGGKNLLMVDSDPVIVVADGKVKLNPSWRAGYRLKVVSLDDPTGTKTAIESPMATFLFSADGGLVYYDRDQNLVKRNADGTQQTLVLAPNEWHTAPVSFPLESPDLRWVLVQKQLVPRPAECFNCLGISFVSLLDGSSWDVADGKGAMGVWSVNWSPDGSRLLIVGSVRRTNGNSDSGGTLYLAAASGGALQAIDQNVDSFTWVDPHHAVIERYTSRSGYPAGTFLRTIP